MSKTLINSWSKLLPLVYRRFFGTEIKGSWNETPRCGKLETSKKSNSCYPKSPSCAENSGVCRAPAESECAETTTTPKQQLACCGNYNLNKKPCSKPQKKRVAYIKPEPFKSMWEVCGIEKICPEEIVRLDEKHYTSSNKLKRIYTKTWESCDPMIRKSKVCCITEDCMPPFEKRLKTECPPTAKEKDNDQLKVDYNILKRCMDNVVENPNTKRINKCRKIVMPCCRPPAKDLKCHKNRFHSNCLKECCPHPSFSECDHPALKQPLPRECGCLDTVNICDANRFYVRKKMFMIPPPLPSWPPKERPK